MISWIIENLATIIICMILIAVVAVIIANVWKNKKNGGASCSSGCAGCPVSDSCHK